MNFLWSLEFIFNKIVFKSNLTDNALCKQLASQNDLTRQVIATKLVNQEEVCYGAEMNKLTKCKWAIKV